MRNSKPKRPKPNKNSTEDVAERARRFQEVYALQGIGADFPLEEDIEEERRQERLREAAQME